MSTRIINVSLGHAEMMYADQTVMNLTHVVHEFSFGPYFPAISQPLDMSIESTPNRTLPLGFTAKDVAFTIFQYFLRVVPTTYIDASRRKLITSQVSVLFAT